MYQVLDIDQICSKDGCNNNVIMGTDYCLEHTPAGITKWTPCSTPVYIDTYNGNYLEGVGACGVASR